MMGTLLRGSAPPDVESVTSPPDFDDEATIDTTSDAYSFVPDKQPQMEKATAIELIQN